MTVSERRPYAVVYDGDCAVCTRMMGVLAGWDRDGVLELIPSRDASVRSRFPWIPPEAYETAIQVVDPDGRTRSGAAGLRHALRVVRRGGVLPWILAAPGAEHAYAWFARYRYALGCGDHCVLRPPPARHAAAGGAGGGVTAAARGAPSPAARVMAATALGLLVAGYFLGRVRLNPILPSDFDQVWAAGKAIIRHQSPYTAVGPHGTILRWGFPLFYPATAAVLVLPLAVLPLVVARAVFAGVSAALLAYVVTRDGYHRLVLFAGASFYVAATFAQWEPLLLAAALIPGAGFVWLAKPNVGVALAAGLSRRGPAWLGVTVGGSAVLLALSLLLAPGWVGAWLAALRGGTLLRVPLLAPPGMLVLLALTRWRRAEARVLVAMACVPQTGLLYAALPIFAVPDTFAEYLILAFCSWAVYGVQWMDARPTDVWTFRVMIANVICIYLPATVMVLRRPNVSVPLRPVGRAARADPA